MVWEIKFLLNNLNGKKGVSHVQNEITHVGFKIVINHYFLVVETIWQ